MRKSTFMFLSCCAIAFITLLHCSTPESPFTNIANVNATVTVQTPQSGWITGDTIDIQIKLSILSFVDSISVHFGDSATEMIKRDSLSDMGVVVVRHIYGAPGDYGIYTTIYLNNNSTKTTKTEPITLKAHVVYHANSSTLGSVPKDSSVYAKGGKVTLKGNTDSLSKTGYDFSGWNTKADGTGSNYNAGSDFIIGANNDLFARWTPSQTTTPKPENLTYPTNPATYTTGTPISANTPTWTGGTPTQFLANPPLPSGLVLNDVTGAITGTPSLIMATATYTITASNTGGFNQTSVILTINPVSTTNRVPEFISGTGNISILENQTANITIVAHDSDMTDTIRWTLIKSLAADSVITTNPAAVQWSALRDTARLTFAPGARAGNYAFTIRISDRKDSASATITVSVGNVNRPPRWSVKDSSFSLKEGQAFSLPLKPLCTDQDGNAIAFTLASGTPATDSLGSDGIYRYTPGFADAGSYTVKVAASDGTLTDTLSLTLTVANTNRKPVWTRPSITATITEGQLLTIPLKDSASDPDSDPLVFTLLPGTPAGDAISTANAYTFTPSMADSGSYTVKISVSDGLLADTLTIALRVTNVDTDRTPPILRRLDPATDSTTLSANATQIKVVAKDSSGVASVTMVLGSNTFNATRSGDSIWTANITGLLPNVFNTITVTATDASAGANASPMTIRIKYDPTMTDNSGPTITPKSGIISDTMIRTAILTSTLEITDASGLDSLYWTLNGTFGGMLLAVSGQQDQYRLLDTLTTYHQNTVVVWAVDKSTNKNRRSVSFAINYNTLPSGVTAVAPANAGTGVENAGLKLIWRKSVDADGDGVSYVVRYGVDAANLAMAAPVSDTGYTPAPALLGHRDYFWIVQCVAGTDTVRSPAVGTFTFTTKNHPPVISGRTPTNNLNSVAATATLGWTIADPDNDQCQTTVYFGTTQTSMVPNNVGANLSFQPTLAKAQQYFWTLRVKDAMNADAGTDTATYTFCTQNDAPVWNLPATHDTGYYKISWNLNSLCADPNGNAITFSIVNGIGVSLNGTTLTFLADSQAITLKAKDAFSAQPCSATVSFTAYSFRNPQMKSLAGGTYRRGDTCYVLTTQMVSVSSFFIDTTEVTQRDYTTLMSSNPSRFTSNALQPVESVSWFDAVLYCNKRSKRDGRDTVYEYTNAQYTGQNCTMLSNIKVNYQTIGYRLPTEAEGEFARRGGTSTLYYWGISDTFPVVNQYEWYLYNAYAGSWKTPHALIEGPQPVARLAPNPFGLYDMSGNVTEWCSDWRIFPYPAGFQADPVGLDTGSIRFRQGGNWTSAFQSLYTSFAAGNYPQNLDEMVGFRVVLPKRRP